MKMDWHSALLTRSTAIDKHYKNTQNVRRFMMEQCGENFRFDRDFMAWIRNDIPKNLVDVVDEWKHRQGL
ncbi:hypothetical protein C2U55_20570 [Enterobacteriaceae bacterium ENNIH3]|nr:hypothetical protein C2U55_20570 [Enterobacteriaceae bacterium ENNIH3]AUV08685.1 hypothetical protein C2U52_21705 [Enterobacteriaceae bacterium ENNIH2]